MGCASCGRKYKRLFGSMSKSRLQQSSKGSTEVAPLKVKETQEKAGKAYPPKTPIDPSTGIPVETIKTGKGGGIITRQSYIRKFSKPK